MEFWDNISGVYDIAESFNGKVYKEMLSVTKAMVPAGANVLDTAAGTGELSLAASVKAWHVTCTDMSEKMLKKARSKAILKNIKNISFEKRNICHLPDKDKSYDAVIAGNVLHLLDNPRQAVRELYRVTRDGGKILLPTFMTADPAFPLMLKLYGLFGYKASANYSPESYIKMLEGCVKGRLKIKNIEGLVPCCYAVIIKNQI